MRSKQPDRPDLVCCKHFKAEFQQILLSLGESDRKVLTFPAFCTNAAHNSAAQNAYRRLRKAEYPAHIFQCSCTQTVERNLDQEDTAQFSQLENCFALFLPQKTIDHFIGRKYYLITPGWLKDWRKQMQDWGFSQPDARAFFAEFTSRLLLLDTGTVEGVEGLLMEFSEYLNLPCEILPVGLEHAELVIARELARVMNVESAVKGDPISDLRSRVADYAMAFDLLGEALLLDTRQEVIEHLERVFMMLFGAGSVDYAAAQSESDGVSAGVEADIQIAVVEKGHWVEGDSFAFSLQEGSQDVLIFLIRSIACPDYMHRYQNLALTMRDACSLALSNASTIEKLRKSRQETEDANAELQSFNYSVSHDLKAPVRYILSYAALLLDESADELSENSRKYIEYIVSAGQQMKSIIDNLLQLSRVSERTASKSPVDLAPLVMEKFAQLKRDEPQRKAELKCVNTAVAEVDEGLITIALDNLIGNAWKYSGRQEKTVIEFGMINVNSDRTFFLRDNGVGFDADNADDLFKPFKRLATSRGFAGTGIGLATVHKVITKCGGRIWAESTPGKGATFFFTLPS